MKKKIMSISVCTLLIISIAFVLIGPMSLGKTNIDTQCCGRLAGCTTLISDNTRLVEVNNSGGIEWKYILGSVDSERLPNGNTLVAGAVLVKEINMIGGIEWQYGTGLLGVSDVERLDNGNTLIADIVNNFVIEVNETGVIKWQKTGLFLPMDAERLDNGNTLIVNNLINSVIEVDINGTTVWEYNTGLWSPTDVERLDSGNTLITDQLNNRVIEINSTGGIVWEKAGLSAPKDAERLENGNTLIVEYSSNTVIEVNESGAIVWSYSSALSGPNDAERVPNEAPIAPTITGPKKGIINVPLPYIFQGDDPGGISIYYWIDWGDGESDGWLGPYLPGTATIPIVHTWTTKGTYTIKAKVKDICDVESDWTEFTVSLPREKDLKNSILLQFLEQFPILKLLIQRLGL
ncbi:hypothetical protein AYK24_00670 [Thermoplasmatales archaeon SG8-52-4]|nr:MAG: hypothetical protein AYK24_00670 [Thermoplasmatales archaeon SG8-52-4]